MDSGLLVSPLNPKEFEGSVFDPSRAQLEPHLPKNFIWPKEFRVEAHEELQAPIVDIEGFLRGDDEATRRAAELIGTACLTHGFFQVINHGVDLDVIAQVHHQMDAFFRLPMDVKLSVFKKPDSMWGYSSAHAERFSSNLPWKETFTFPYYNHTSEPVVTNYFKSKLGEDFEQTGAAFQKYCDGVKELGVKLTELVAICLGVDRMHFREFFEEGCSIMRCNYYPVCQEPSLTIGTGPHCDPTSLTILHQDQVGGLDVFVDDKWQTVHPRPDAFVVNIGDTFKALTNGRYKSCLHRAMVNKYKERTSLAFFMCPKADMVVRPPEVIVRQDGTRQYPDFTWSQFRDFTQEHHRVDEVTLPDFTKWLLSSKQQTI